MDRVLHFILHHRILVCSIFLVLVVASLVMIPLVQVNYDLAEYLPEESTTKQAITVLEEEFSYPGTASVLSLIHISPRNTMRKSSSTCSRTGCRSNASA